MTRRFWDIRLQKCGHLEIRVRDQSRSSKPTRISIRRVLLTFHSNRGSISYRFRDERRFLPLMKLCYIVLCTLTNVTNTETVQDHGNDVDCFSLNMRCSKSLCSYRVLLNLWSHARRCLCFHKCIWRDNRVESLMHITRHVTQTGNYCRT